MAMTIMRRYRLGHDECRKLQIRHNQSYQYQKDQHSLFYHRVTGVTQRSIDRISTIQFKTKQTPPLSTDASKIDNIHRLPLFTQHLNLLNVRFANRFYVESIVVVSLISNQSKVRIFQLHTHCNITPP